jgi:hypothetical protein
LGVTIILSTKPELLADISEEVGPEAEKTK